MENMTGQLDELAATARSAGFTLTDARGLPVEQELQAYLEDDNLGTATARISFLEPVAGEVRGVVAIVTVKQQQFKLHGDWSRVGQLQLLLGGAAAPPSRRPDQI